MSNLMAVLLQTLSARLGVVTGYDLAQACRAEYSRGVNFVLWVPGRGRDRGVRPGRGAGDDHRPEAPVRHPAALGLPGHGASTRSSCSGLQRWGMRTMEALILALVATIGVCFLLQIFMARPDPVGMVARPAAELAVGVAAVRRDRHPGGDGDAAQPLPPLGAGADRGGSAPTRRARRWPAGTTCSTRRWP